MHVLCSEFINLCKFDNHLDLYKSIIKILKKFLKKDVEEIDEEIIELIKKSRLAKCKSLNNFYNCIRSLENITKKPIWSLTQGKYQHFSDNIISRQFVYYNFWQVNPCLFYINWQLIHTYMIILRCGHLIFVSATC